MRSAVGALLRYLHWIGLEHTARSPRCDRILYGCSIVNLLLWPLAARSAPPVDPTICSAISKRRSSSKTSGADISRPLVPSSHQMRSTNLSLPLHPSPLLTITGFRGGGKAVHSRSGKGFGSARAKRKTSTASVHEDFCEFLTNDAHYDVWTLSPQVHAPLVWDRHDLIYAYGPPMVLRHVERQSSTRSASRGRYFRVDDRSERTIRVRRVR